MGRGQPGVDSSNLIYIYKLRKFFFSFRFSVLGNYIEDVYAAYEQHKLETMDPVRGGKCANVREMTEEEAAA
ncbi:hypothetical protein Hanom_Chr08g00752961 [Helianthus anomalus]